MLKERATQHKVNQETYGLLFADLLAGPATCYDLVDVTGLHLTTVQDLMRVLKRHKVVHIVGWEKDSLGRDATPIFAFGRGHNKPRSRLTPAERQKRVRDRKRALAEAPPVVLALTPGTTVAE